MAIILTKIAYLVVGARSDLRLCYDEKSITCADKREFEGQGARKYRTFTFARLGHTNESRFFVFQSKSTGVETRCRQTQSIMFPSYLKSERQCDDQLKMYPINLLYKLSLWRCEARQTCDIAR